MYNVTHDLVPERYARNFTKVSDRHNIRTRSATSLNLVIPNYDLEVYRKSITYRGPLYWILVDSNVKNSTSFDVFKRSILTSGMF